MPIPISNNPKRLSLIVPEEVAVAVRADVVVVDVVVAIDNERFQQSWNKPEKTTNVYVNALWFTSMHKHFKKCVAFQSFEYEHTRWRSFHELVMRTKFDIDVLFNFFYKIWRHKLFFRKKYVVFYSWNVIK